MISAQCNAPPPDASSIRMETAVKANQGLAALDETTVPPISEIDGIVEILATSFRARKERVSTLQLVRRSVGRRCRPGARSRSRSARTGVARAAMRLRREARCPLQSPR